MSNKEAWFTVMTFPQKLRKQLTSGNGEPSRWLFSGTEKEKGGHQLSGYAEKRIFGQFETLRELIKLEVASHHSL